MTAKRRWFSRSLVIVIGLLLIVMGIFGWTPQLPEAFQSPQGPTLRWATEVKLDPLGNHPTVGPDGTIYLGECLTAFRPDGTPRWQTDCTRARQLVIDQNGDIYDATEKVAYYPDGKTKWQLKRWPSQIEYGWHIQPAITRESLFLSSEDGGGTLGSSLAAVDLADGNIRWERVDLAQWIPSTSRSETLKSVTFPSPPVVRRDGSIFVSAAATYETVQGELRFSFVRYEFSPTGSVIDVTVSNPIPSFGRPPQARRVMLEFSTVLGPDNTAYLAYDDRSEGGTILYAIGPDGALKWTWSSPKERFHSEPVLGPDGTIYLALANDETDDTTLAAIRPHGETAWRFTVPRPADPYGHTPAVGADGTVYWSAQSELTLEREDLGQTSTLYAISPDGSERWQRGIDAQIRSSLTLNEDGTLYFTARTAECERWPDGPECSEQGWLYALQTTSPGLADSPWPMLRGDPQHTGQVQTVGDDQ